MKKTRVLHIILFCFLAFAACSNDFIFGIVEFATVSFDSRGGGEISSKTVKIGESITLPTPIRTDYTFEGWYSAANGGIRYGGGGDKYSVNERTTMYARWMEEIVWGSTHITITTEEQLREFAAQVNSGKNFSGQTIILANDIDLRSEEWTPIGTNNRVFAGTFDGGYKVVKNIYISGFNQSDFQGFFGASRGTIRNLGLFNIDIRGGGTVGGLVSWNYGTIQNCYASGIVSATGNRVGGLVGDNGAAGVIGTISNCYANVNVEGFAIVGGLVGFNGNAVTENSYALGTVRGRENVGGLAGYNGSSSSSGTIRTSYATGNIHRTAGTDAYFGGLVGWNLSASGSRPASRVENGYASGNTTVSSGTAVSRRLIGGGASSTGNTAMHSASDLKLRGTYNSSWDFANVWNFHPDINNGFPHLRVFH